MTLRNDWFELLSMFLYGYLVALIVRAKNIWGYRGAVSTKNKERSKN